MLPLIMTLASPSQLVLCCKGAESVLGKVTWVDCIIEDTSEGNLRAVL